MKGLHTHKRRLEGRLLAGVAEGMGHGVAQPGDDRDQAAAKGSGPLEGPAGWVDGAANPRGPEGPPLTARTARFTMAITSALEKSPL